MTPPPAEDLVPRLFLGPALRAQSDQRLVRLVRDGYEVAFNEIMRRYGTALRRYASAIVGGRAEDVTQDAFSKALQALRRDEREIELRPWLYRIVRNTALNDIRDRHPGMVVLGEGIVGSQGVAEEVERREEVGELIDRLRALPEPQRAAIVMRELEGLGHDEIASALGVSDGAARQAIHRARTALRNGVGMAIPLPLLRAMLEVAPSAEVAAGGVGVGLVLKAATATVLVAGSFGAGVALHQSRHPSLDAAKPPEAARNLMATGRQPTSSNDAAASAASDRRRSGQGQRSRHDSGSSRRGDSGRDSTNGGPQRGPGDESSNSGSDKGNRHSGAAPSGPGGQVRNPEGSPDGGNSGQGSTATGEDNSGPSGNSGPGSVESGGGSGETVTGDGKPGSGDSSGSGEALESNSGPDSSSDGSGGGDNLSSGSGDPRDSSSGTGFSGETQLQP